MIEATRKKRGKEEKRFKLFFRSVSCRKYSDMFNNLLEVNLISGSV